MNCEPLREAIRHALGCLEETRGAHGDDVNGYLDEAEGTLRAALRADDDAQTADAAETPETVARFFHETYERLAPDYGYKTREDSAVPWAQVPETNRALMIAVAVQVSARFLGGCVVTGRATNLRQALERVHYFLSDNPHSGEQTADDLEALRVIDAALRADDDARTAGAVDNGPLGPTPAEAREITDRLCRTLMEIASTPRHGGPATLGGARRIAFEVARDLPQLYLIRPQHWQRKVPS